LESLARLEPRETSAQAPARYARTQTSVKPLLWRDRLWT
jgi:hypothetical protein